MKPEQQQIQEIRDRFSQMQNKADLLNLLNYAKGIAFIQNEKSKPIRTSTLNWYADNRLSKGKRYIEFDIPKKNGSTRKIHAPARSLKTIQRCINLVLQCVFEPHPAATGFRPKLSVVNNAKRHTSKNYVYNLDLKDFFPSIELHRVKACFINPPFGLSGEREPLAFFLANLCCHELEVERNGEMVKRAVLPQGAPTSPTITNIVANRLDRKLSGLARKFGVEYSRYADDMTFSSSHQVYQKDGDFLTELHKIIESQNFRINPEKTRLQKSVYRQEVTGIIVNKHVNVTKKYIKEIRLWLHVWEKYGYDELSKLLSRYDYSSKANNRNILSIINVLEGKLQYALMVRGKDDLLVNKYLSNFKRLVSHEKYLPVNNMDQIIEVLITQGLEKGMNLFTINNHSE